jgi:hypothetical protein
MPQTATARSLPAAFRMMQAMPAEGIDGARTIAAPRATGMVTRGNLGYSSYRDRIPGDAAHRAAAGPNNPGAPVCQTNPGATSTERTRAHR